MEFTKVIESRHSIRNYKTDEVPQDIQEKLMKALQLAPTGNNKQEFKFVFVTDAKTRNALATRACNQSFVADVPLLVFATSNKGGEFNVAIAIDHMVLEATNQGLGTCWMGWYDSEVAREILNVPADKSIPIMVAVGYPGESPQPRPRKPLSELISRDTY